MNRIYTIGYEGADLQDFIATLHHAGIDVLVDVRELPISRRKGFSKRQLNEALTEAGIDYRHVRELGSPKPVRDQLRLDGNYPAFFAAYTEYLDTQQPLLHTLTDELDGNVALMCYERDPATCHRSTVADRLAYLSDTDIQHLGVRKHAAKYTDSGKSMDVGQGLSAA